MVLATQWIKAINRRETYAEFYPNIGAMKIYTISDSTIGIFDISGGYHISQSDPNPFGPGTSRPELDNLDLTFPMVIESCMII